jgi:hypothetical protein
MSRHRRQARYARRVEAAAARALAEGRIQPGTLCMIDVLHDDWCNQLAGKGPCNCNPAIRGPYTTTVDEMVEQITRDAAASSTSSPATPPRT